MPISVASPRSGSRLTAPLREIVRATLALEGARAGEIAIVLSDDAALRALNRTYRGIDRATDVLSFSYEEPETAPAADSTRAGGSARSRDILSRSLTSKPTPPVRGSAGFSTRPRRVSSRRQAQLQPLRAIHGDLVISLARLHVQAKRYRVSAGRELARLVVHGALHLAGHDHHRASERQRMRGREAEAMRAARVAIAKLDAVLDDVAAERAWRTGKPRRKR